MSAAKQDFKMIIYIKKIMRLDTKQTWLFDWSYILNIKNIYIFFYHHSPRKQFFLQKTK